MEFDPSIPIWMQLVDEFTRRIVTGEWASGARIGGVRDLAAELRVNPNTIQRALAELERRNLCFAERATGRFVTDDVAAIDAARLVLAAEAATDYARRAHGLGMSLTAARELLGRQWSPTTEGGQS